MAGKASFSTGLALLLMCGSSAAEPALSIDERRSVESRPAATLAEPPKTDAGEKEEPDRPSFKLGPSGQSSSVKSLASRYAALSPGACRAELRKRKIPTGTAKIDAKGVAVPVRLPATMNGVRFIVPGGRSKYGVLDCRLVIALHELTRILERHAVVAMHVGNFYRPKAHLAGRKVPSQHSHGLAADIVAFTLANGKTLLVERDWHGAIGEQTCGPDAEPFDPDGGTIALRDLVCDIARERLFHHLLTPNFNVAHADHLHADIQRGNKTCGIR